MKRTIAAVLVCMGVVACLSATGADKPATQPAGKLAFKNVGFAIAPLDEPGKVPTVALSMCLPGTGGFASNVNVQTQPWEGSLDSYNQLSKQQFEQMSIKIVAERRVGDEELAWEYSGTMQARSLHFYARALLRDGTVYLATATAMESQWKDVADKLKSCVDSLELLPVASTAKAGPTTRPAP